MDRDEALRTHLLKLLDGGQAHLDFKQATADLPPQLRGATVPNVPYSPWQLLEHLRIAQWDIVEFSQSAAHVSPDWPDDYWPREQAPPSDDAWEQSRAQFRADLEQMRTLIRDPQRDLLAPFPHGDGQTLLREALLLADHNAYHLGQLIVVRRALGAWSDA